MKTGNVKKQIEHGNWKWKIGTWKNGNMGKLGKMSEQKEGPKTMLEMTAAKFWAFSIPEDMESVKFWKIRFLGQIWAKFQVLGTKYLVPSTWYQVLGAKYLVPSAWHQVLGTKYLSPSTWYLVLGTKYLVPSTWYQVLGNKYFVPSTWYQVLRS